MSRFGDNLAVDNASWSYDAAVGQGFGMISAAGDLCEGPGCGVGVLRCVPPT